MQQCKTSESEIDADSVTILTIVVQWQPDIKIVFIAETIS